MLMKILNWLCNLFQKKKLDLKAQTAVDPPPFESIKIREVSDYLKLSGFRVNIGLSGDDGKLSYEDVEGIVKDLSDNCKHLILEKAKYSIGESPPTFHDVLNIPIARIQIINVINRFMGMGEGEYSKAMSPRMESSNCDIRLVTAITNGKITEAHNLLKAGADANARDGNGTPVLNIASQIGLLEAVRLLLEHGADIEGKNALGTTALMAAVVRNNNEIIRLLLEKGANREANAQGETAFSIAAQLGHQEIMELLAPLSELARSLLSTSIEVSDAAIRQVLDLSKGGSREGLKALEEAICWTRGQKTTDFYSPGLRRTDWLTLDEAPKKLIALAEQNALWTTPVRQVQELISLSQVGGTDVRSLWSKAKELNCGWDQIRAIQLLGLHLAVQVILRK
jgi:hypothetical protein